MFLIVMLLLLLIPVLLMFNENLINKTEANIMRSVFPIGNFYTDNFKKMRSSLFSNEFETKNRGKSILGKVPMLFLFFIITIILTYWIADSNNQLLLIYLIIDAVIFGVLFIIAGWLEFSLLQTIEAIPISKIEGAAEGLNEIQGRLIPENGDPLTSPMSKQKCVSYKMELQKYVRDSNVNVSYWQTISTVTEGVPTLIEDETGYLTIDFSKSDFSCFKQTFFYAEDSNKKIIFDNSPLGQNLIQTFNAKKANFNPLEIGVTLSNSPNLTTKLYGHELAINEVIIPFDQKIFAMGRVINTHKTFNGKPVKQLTRDSSTGVLSIRIEGKRAIEKKDKTLAYLSLTFGAILLITGLFYLF